MIRTVGELRAALAVADLPDEAELVLCIDASVDPDDESGRAMVDPGAVRTIEVVRPGDPGWVLTEADNPPPALVYLLVGDWA